MYSRLLYSMGLSEKYFFATDPKANIYFDVDDNDLLLNRSQFESVFTGESLFLAFLLGLEDYL